MLISNATYGFLLPSPISLALMIYAPSIFSCRVGKAKGSLSVKTIHAVDAFLGGELAVAADALVGRGATAGAGGEVHLALGVLVH